MIRSLLMKLAMLAMTMGVVFWIGWQGPQRSFPQASLDIGSQEFPASEIPSLPETKEAVEPKKPAELLTAAASGKPVPTESRRVRASHAGLLDLNRASAEEIDALPGIGLVLAERVIAYRTTAGGFRSIDDLRRVKGIGAKKLDRLRPLIMVSAPAASSKTEKTPL